MYVQPIYTNVINRGVMPEKMYNLEEVAEFLATTPRELRRYISDGKLPAVKIGKSWKVAESTIEKIQSGELVI